MNFELRAASDLIITFFAGVLDLKGYYFKYANAGQNHPFLLRGGQALELAVSGSGLGYAAAVSYVEQAIALLSGDVLTLYTDGLVEPGASAGSVPVKAALLFANVEYSPDYHRRLMEEALAKAGRTDFDDDVTLVTARIE